MVRTNESLTLCIVGATLAVALTVYHNWDGILLLTVLDFLLR